MPFVHHKQLYNFLLVDGWNCSSSVTIQQLEQFPKLFRISSWDTLHIHNMVFALRNWDTTSLCSSLYLSVITEIRSVPWFVVFEITFSNSMCNSAKATPFFWAKTPLRIRCSIIAINVLSKVARFHQHSCETEVYPVKKLYVITWSLKICQRIFISKLIVVGM